MLQMGADIWKSFEDPEHQEDTATLNDFYAQFDAAIHQFSKSFDEYGGFFMECMKRLGKKDEEARLQQMFKDNGRLDYAEIKKFFDVCFADISSDFFYMWLLLQATSIGTDRNYAEICVAGLAYLLDDAALKQNIYWWLIQLPGTMILNGWKRGLWAIFMGLLFTEIYSYSSKIETSGHSYVQGVVVGYDAGSLAMTKNRKSLHYVAASPRLVIGGKFIYEMFADEINAVQVDNVGHIAAIAVGCLGQWIDKRYG